MFKFCVKSVKFLCKRLFNLGGLFFQKTWIKKFMFTNDGKNSFFFTKTPTALSQIFLYKKPLLKSDFSTLSTLPIITINLYNIKEGKL